MPQALEQDYVPNDHVPANVEEAQRRADAWRSHDPFPAIPAALLSSEHIQAYVKQTAMLHPFFPEKGKLKAASYEIRPGGQFVSWDEGKKRSKYINAATNIVLPPNSISFIQLESKIRLPDYIAMRFNLRIKHVHRGILLGTGPLVDPGYSGQLLIPLHNLTSAKYRIKAGEGIIWAEFTKTSRGEGAMEHGNAQTIAEAFFPTDPDKTDRPIEYYFEKANGNRPIQSSIPDAIRTARQESSKASKDAEEAKKANQFFAGLGLLAVLSLVVSLYSFIQTADNNQRVSGEKAIAAEGVSRRAQQEVERLAGRLKVIEDKGHAPSDVGGGDEAKRRLNELEGQLAALRQQVDGILAKGGAVKRQIPGR